MRVVQFPDYRRDNPYQQLLANALGLLGVEVVFPAGYRRGLPFSRAMASQAGLGVLHLHWLTPYLKGQSYAAKAIYAFKLLLDLQLLKARSVRLIWTVHNLVSHDTKTPKLELWLSRRLAVLADHLIVHSEGAKLAVIDKFGVNPDKVAVIPHGDFADAYGDLMPEQDARLWLDLDRQKPVFLFFGMIRPYKGVEQLLEVWSRTPLLHENSCLVIAGDARDPDLANSIVSAAKDCPSVRLHMRFIPDEEVPLFFSAANWVVLPFAQSLTSGTLALAQTYNRPVVAPLREGTSVASDQPRNILYDPSDENALSVALASALATPSSEGDGRGNSQISARAGWSEIATMHSAIYGLTNECGVDAARFGR